MMKKVCIVMVLVGMFLTVGYMECHYTRKNCEITNIQNSKITCVDESGNAWEFYADGYKIGEKINLKMHTNGTNNNIQDDEILKVVRVD